MKKSRLGQNFLINRNVARKIVEAFLPVEGPILEIGPGRGVLTELLIQKQPPASIIAVEFDQELCLLLKKKFDRQIILINRDILKINLADICDNQPVNIISNAPYYISREILDWIIQQNTLIRTGTVMMQREVVDKLLPRQKNGLNDPRMLLFNVLYSPVKEFMVSPGSFSPSPKVQSVVFSFKKRKTLPSGLRIPELYSFLKICFFNRRKTLNNNLTKRFSPATICEIKPQFHSVLNQRAEELQMGIFLDLFKAIERIEPT